jgi:hypothetical protein
VPEKGRIFQNNSDLVRSDFEVPCDHGCSG